jgi:glycosyltransferase involved in cell wall biosynthesis
MGRYEMKKSDISEIKVFALQRKGVTPIRTTAWYQRMHLLACMFPVSVLVEGKHEVASDLANHVSIRRSPIITKGQNSLGRFVNTLIFLIWAFSIMLRTRLNCRKMIVYSHHGFEAPLGALMTLFGCRWIVDVLDAPDLYLESAEDMGRAGQTVKAAGLRFFVALMRRILRRADLVITIATRVDNGLALLLNREYGVSSQHILPVPNGVNLEAILKYSSQLEDSSPDEKFRIFYVGSISHHRGADTILAAVEILSPQIQELEVVLAGPVDDQFRGIFEKWLSRPNVRPFIRVTGRIPNNEVLRWVARSQICLFPFPSGPGLDETIPIKVFEYLAMKRPVIASNLPGIRHIIRHGVNGYLVKPSDSQKLASAIRQLYKNPQILRHLAENAPKILENFSWDRINVLIKKRITQLVDKSWSKEK